MTIKNKIVLRGSHVHSNFCPCRYTVARKVGSAGLKLLQIRFQDTLIQCLHGKSDRFVFAFSYIVIFNVQLLQTIKKYSLLVKLNQHNGYSKSKEISIRELS